MQNTSLKNIDTEKYKKVVLSCDKFPDSMKNILKKQDDGVKNKINYSNKRQIYQANISICCATFSF